MTAAPKDHTPAVEQVIRDVIADNPDLPIRGDFYRGIVPPAERGLFGDPIRREYVRSEACGADWFVNALPGATEVIVAALGRQLFDVNDVIGEVTVLSLPQTTPGVVDAEALSGSRFHVELLGAIREKAAVVAEMRAAVTR
jgi:hypothetical protein